MYEQVFFWIGVASAAFFVLLGMSVFAAWVMDMVWRKFLDGKQLADVIFCWQTYGAEAKEARDAEMTDGA